MIGDWLSSDRPPLQTGFVLLQWPLWTVQGRPGAYQFLGTVLQSAWLPALWITFRVRGDTVSRTCVAVLATSATGVMFFNTVYIWPKMLAGALALAALAILVSRDPADRSRGAGVIAAALAALSMLAHGGTFFALLALVPFVILLRRKVTAWAVAACAAAVAVLYLPWLLYQHFVNPPGNRLVKWMLASVIPIDHRGILQTIIDQYRSVPLTRLLGNKLDNLTTLVANMGLWQSQHAERAWTPASSATRGSRGSTTSYRRRDRCCSAPSRCCCRRPAAGSRTSGRSRRSPRSRSRPGWCCSGAGRPARRPGHAQIHQGPYVAISRVHRALRARRDRTAARALRRGPMASAAWFVVEWLPGLAFRPQWLHHARTQPVDWSMAILCGCALAVIIAIVLAARGKRARR